MLIEDVKKRNAPLIRIVRIDLDWGNTIKQDLQITAMRGEQLRRQLFKREINIVNIYVSTYPPVDTYEHYLEKKYTFNQKTKITNYLIDRENAEESLQKIGDVLGEDVSIPLKKEAEYEDIDVEILKHHVLTKMQTETEEKRKIFNFGKPFFTYLFIIIQLVMFVILELNGGSKNIETLVQFGAKYNVLILEGEWWRFITPMFLHIGLLHLFMNTLALFYLGIAVESIFGRSRFLWIYVFSGIMGSVASFVFSPSISAGASGAIFGCFGALLYLGVTHPRLFFRTIGLNVIVIIVINLIFGFTFPGIDNAGHIGGLVGGFLASGIVHFPKKRRFRYQVIYSLLAAIVISSLLYIGFNGGQLGLNTEMVNNLAQAKNNEGKHEEAYELIHNYLKEEEGDALTYFNLSFAEYQLGMVEEAKKHLYMAIEIEPEFHEAHYYLALVFLEEKKIVDAKEHLEKAIAISDEDHYEKLYKKIEEEN